MNCPKCNRKLKIVESRQLSATYRYQEHLCVGCELLYVSDNRLDPVPVEGRDKGINKMINRMKNGGGG